MSIENVVTDPDQVVNSFEPISLQQMDNVKLQDRLDTKFVFNANDLVKYLEVMKEHYRVLEVDGKRYSNYETLYFDTKDFELYRAHHNGRVNRFKFRSRHYVESDLNFFEVKFKNNKGRTIKDRIKKTSVIHELTQQSSELIKSLSKIDPATLHPTLWVNYRRMTFVSKFSKERLTMDTQLVFKDDKNEVPYNGLVIAEVKQEKSLDKSHFVGLMRKSSIAQHSISKYCLGVVSLHPEVKRNNFKPILLYLNKLLRAS